MFLRCHFTELVGVTRDISIRKNAELELEKQNQELAKTLAEKEELLKEVKVLRELLQICSGCRRIRDENNQWWSLDEYVRAHTDTNFTHTICPSCKDIYYPDLKNRILPLRHRPFQRQPALDNCSVTVYEQRDS
jgi:hypothetical protein